MHRRDWVDYLIHWTGREPATDEEAFQTLDTIIASGELRCGTGKIKGSYCCVCFTETPLEFELRRYRRFGVVVSKQWLFRMGGRPVIYQTDSEYFKLPVELQWRHVRYELDDGVEKVDWTWEREWRILTPALPIDPSSASIVVPNAEWERRLRSHHDWREHYKVWEYYQILGETAEHYREPFRWDVTHPPNGS